MLLKTPPNVDAPPGINAGAKYNAAALPIGDLTIFLTPLVIDFTRLPKPYNCLGICPLDIVIYLLN
jgi:hypothetical protein